MSLTRSSPLLLLLLLLLLFLLNPIARAVSPEGRLFEPKLPANLDTGGSTLDRAEDFIVQALQRFTNEAQVTAVTLLESYAAEQGNICDLGNLATVCVIERSKLWTSNSVFISSRGAGHDSVASVPFISQGNCSCDTTACMCQIIIENYRPPSRALDSAAITVDIASTDYDAAAGKVVEYISVNGHTLTSNFSTPSSKICDGFYPAVTAANVLPYITHSVDRLEVRVKISAAVLSPSEGVGMFQGCRPRLNVRATVRGSYRQEGVLVIREGARLQCSTPGCVITLRNLRALVMKTSSSILAERVVVEVPQVNISGIIQGHTVDIVAATLNIGSDGVLISSDRSNTSTAITINVNPSNLIQRRASNYLLTNPPDHLIPNGCDASCVDCYQCLTVDGAIRFSSVSIIARGLLVGPLGEISASGLGYPSQMGPLAGSAIAATLNATGSGGGHGGMGSLGCGVYRWDSNYNTYGSLVWNGLGGFGSGGGDGQVQGGQGGGAVFLQILQTLLIYGKVSSNGESSRCTKTQGGASLSSGGGGAGGSVSIIAGSFLGGGRLEALGGDAVIGCSGISAPYSGGAGGGGRILLRYSAASTADTIISADGGSCMCVGGGAGTIMDFVQQTLRLRSSSSPISFIGGQFPSDAIASVTPLPLSIFQVPGSSTLIDIKVLLCQGTGVIAGVPGVFIDTITVQGGAAVLGFGNLTMRARQIIVEGRSRLGCVTCGIGAGMGVSVPSCAVSCLPFRLQATSLVLSGATALMGSDITLHVANIEVRQNASIQFSDSWIKSRLTITSCDQLQVNGLIRFSQIAVECKRILIAASSSIEASRQGSWGGTGAGNGTSSPNGGGGGAYGGQGADSCNAQAARGGSGFGDPYVPVDMGSGGGHGSGLVTGFIEYVTGSPTVISTTNKPFSFWEYTRIAGLSAPSGRSCLQRGSSGSPCTTCCPSGFIPSYHADWCCSTAFPDCDCLPGGPVPPSFGGRGGGYVRVISTEILQNDGIVAADGENVYTTVAGVSTGGGGAGGSVYITAVTFSGSGTISADGGLSISASVLAVSGGGGSGGRISVEPARGIPPNTAFGCAGGASSSCAFGGYGTMFISRNSSLAFGIKHNEGARLQKLCDAILLFAKSCPISLASSNRNVIRYAPTFLPPSVGTQLFSLILYAGSVLPFPPNVYIGRLVAFAGAAVVPWLSSRTLTAGSVLIDSGSILGCVPCSLGLTLRNGYIACGGGCLPFTISVVSLEFRSGSFLYGIYVNIMSTSIIVGAGSSMESSDVATLSTMNISATNVLVTGSIKSSSVFVRSATLEIETVGVISSEGLGQQQGAGKGITSNSGGGGGGYGANGADSCSGQGLGGQSYGDAYVPTDMGSGGGDGEHGSFVYGARGGGRIRLDVSKSMRHQGVISSDGNPGFCHATGSASGGGGSAGSVLIYCPQINGSGIVSAIGGSVLSGCDRSFSGGGGGGGRIAIYTVPTARGLTLRYSAFGGVSSGCTQGGAGTVFYNHTQTLYVDQGYSPPSVTQKLLAKNFVPHASMNRIGSRDLPTSHNLSNALANRGINAPWASLPGPDASRPLSAMTRCPPGVKGMNVEIRGGAVLIACADRAASYTADGSGALLLFYGASTAAAASSVLLKRGGHAGCYPCAHAIAAANRHPGCGITCPPFSIVADTLTVQSDSGVVGSDVTLQVSKMLMLDDGAWLANSDNLEIRQKLTVNSTVMTIAGLVSFPSISINGRVIVIESSGRVDASGLGFFSATGVSAGKSGAYGGGGGGSFGSGSSSCYVAPDGSKTAGGMGRSWIQSDVRVIAMGSGGGQYTPAQAAGQGSAQRVASWKAFMNEAAATGSLTSRSGGVLGGSVDAVKTGQGGRGGGTVSISAIISFRHFGTVAVDGAPTSCSAGVYPGGGGGGGTISLDVPILLGSGKLMARGGASSSGCPGVLSGGGGGGGAILLKSGLSSGEITSSANGGTTDCGNCRKARFCSLVNSGSCVFANISDEFSSNILTNAGWSWFNKPSRWSVSSDLQGWLLTEPSFGTQFFSQPTAHRLYFQGQADDIYDFGASIVLKQSRGSKCLSSGIYVHSIEDDDWVALAVVDDGYDASLQFYGRGLPIFSVINFRGHNYSTAVQLRMRRGSNGTITALWRKDDTRAWSPISMYIHPKWSHAATFQVGLFFARCENAPSGVMQGVNYTAPYVMVDWVRDWTCDAVGRSLFHSGRAGVVMEEGLPPDAIASSGSLSTAFSAAMSVTALSPVKTIKLNSTQTARTSSTGVVGPSVSVIVGGTSAAWAQTLMTNISTAGRYLEFKSFVAGEFNLSETVKGIDQDLPRNLPVGEVHVNRLTSFVDNSIISQLTPELVVDCQGGPFFSSNSSLFLVDVVARISNCVFLQFPEDSADWDVSTYGYSLPSVLIWRSAVTFNGCTFTAPSISLGGGGISMQHSIVQCKSCSFTKLSGGQGGAVSVGGLFVRAGGMPHWGADDFSMSSRQGFLYLIDTQVATCRSRNNGGVMSVAFGHIVYVFRSALARSSARNYGGLIHTESGGSVVLLSSSMTDSSARIGGCISIFSGSVFAVNTTLSMCSALRGGGAVSLVPAITAHPLFRDTQGDLLDGQVKGARLQTSVGLHSSFIAYGSTVSNHFVLGVTSEPGDGAVMLMKGGGRAVFERCSVKESSLPAHHSGGGLASILDSGELYMRDSTVSNMTATYGAVLRVYQSSHAGQVGSIQTGIIGVLFDNCTFISNVARRHGAVLSAYSPTRVFFRPFEYTASGGLLYTSDLGFLGRPLQRFGFNGNPNEDPWMATIAPNGQTGDRFNPYEDIHYSKQLPADGHLTNQWPFVNSDQRTLVGQKAGSGGIAFISESGDSLVAFKDSTFFQNLPSDKAACYFHSELDIKQCLVSTFLN